ncbi:MAG: sporulation protein [Candidatus Micrarchaeia archaeon]
MVLGIGAGKIDLILNKTAFLPGEEIEGKIILNLKKPIKARELKVTLYSKERSISNKKNTIKTKNIHSIKVSGGLEYSSGEFDFKLPIPSALQFQNGILGQIQSFASMVSGTEYYIKATLDLPMATDINSNTKIIIENKR